MTRLYSLTCTINLLELVSELTVQPQGRCICPDHSYSCRADSAVEIEWDEKRTLMHPLSYDIERDMRTADLKREGLRVLFSEVSVEGGGANLTALLFITDQHTWNRSNFTCKASGSGGMTDHTETVCVTGKILHS